MKARPILFTGSMVRAIRDGRKTQTRRVVKPQPAGAWAAPGKTACPYGRPGDLLWVRETWAAVRAETDWETGFVDGVEEVSLGERGSRIWYRVDYGFDDILEVRDFRWRPSIHMPRRASRLTLRLTDVRVERLQNISEEDALAEGMREDFAERGKWCGHNECLCVHYGPNWHFVRTWDAINAKRGYGWEANPWVWALTFEPIWQNVDEVETKHPAFAG